MAKRKNKTETPETSAATVGYEAQLWQMADALRGSMDAAEYKHVVLGSSPGAEGKRGVRRLREGKRWQYGVLPAGNAHFAWMQQEELLT